VPRPAPVTVAYWKSLSGPRHDAQVALTDSFNSSQDSVRVALTHVGEYGPAADKLRIALAAGDPPGVMMLGTNAELPAFARLGALLPLDDHARHDPDVRLGAFAPGFVRDSRFDGALYQLPFARSVPLLYANRSLLASAGLPDTAASLPASWPAFLETAERFMRTRRMLTAADDTSGAAPAPAAFGAGTSYWELQATLWAFGAAYSASRTDVRIDSPPSIAAMGFYADLFHRQRVAIATKNAQLMFLQGQIAQFIGSSANLMQIEDSAGFPVAIAPVPGSREVGVPGGGAGLSLIASAPRTKRDAGWRFMSYMTSAASSASFARATGYVPVRPDALADESLRTVVAQRPAFRLALDQAAVARPVDAIIAAPSVSKRIEEALEAIVFKGAPVGDTCAALALALRRAAQEN